MASAAGLVPKGPGRTGPAPQSCGHQQGGDGPAATSTVLGKEDDRHERDLPAFHFCLPEHRPFGHFVNATAPPAALGLALALH